MGEIADMMLEGILCEGCGEYLGEGDIGVPRYCVSCAQERGIDDIDYDFDDVPIPKVAVMKYCPYCGKRCKTHNGVIQHAVDKHNIAALEALKIKE